MTRKNAIGSLCVAVFLGVAAFPAACTPAHSAGELTEIGEPVPDVFEPLSWTQSPEQVRGLFPNAEIRDDIPGYDVDEPVTVMMVYDVHWPRFGDSVANVARDGEGRIRWIGIETTETREACWQDGGPGPSWCRSNYNAELVAILEDLRRGISSRYGPPLETFRGPDPNASHPGDAKELAYRWRRVGFDVSLSINLAEDGAWAVSLFAMRQRRP